MKLKIDRENKVLVILQMLKTQFFVLIGMIMFRASDFKVFLQMLVNLFHKGERFSLIKVIEAPELIVLALSLVVLLLSAVIKMKKIDLEAWFNGLETYQKYLLCFGAACVILIFGAYGLEYLPPDPIYGGF